MLKPDTFSNAQILRFAKLNVFKMVYFRFCYDSGERKQRNFKRSMVMWLLFSYKSFTESQNGRDWNGPLQTI